MTGSFSSWREGSVYYVPLLGLGAVSCALGWMVAGALGLGLGACCALFFRDPRRVVPDGADVVVAPADGMVVGIEELESTEHYEGRCRRVSIFLSIFDVHVNRSPCHGTVLKTVYKPGAFKDARKPETTDCNESNAIWLTTAKGGVTVRQIAGAVARRIVCVVREGDDLDKGEKFGMIKFGSRTELYLPLEVEVCVRVRDKVKAGSSVIGRFV